MIKCPWCGEDTNESKIGVRHICSYCGGHYSVNPRTTKLRNIDGLIDCEYFTKVKRLSGHCAHFKLGNATCWQCTDLRRF